MTIAIRYVFFALLAAVMNIGTQYMSLRIYNGQFGLYVAMFCGTLAGLIIKYMLDKKYIFQFKTNTLREDSFKFVLYSLMGIFTTLIFWGFELVFNAVLTFDSAKYIGALIGLSIGYSVKYQLDKRMVFTHAIFNKIY